MAATLSLPFPTPNQNSACLPNSTPTLGDAAATCTASRGFVNRSPGGMCARPLPYADKSLAVGCALAFSYVYSFPACPYLYLCGSDSRNPAAFTRDVCVRGGGRQFVDTS